MNRKFETRIASLFVLMPLFLAVLSAPLSISAQPGPRLVGSITAIGDNSVTVKTDTGDVRQVAIPAGINIKRISPGQRDLNSAVTLHFSDLAAGDRVLLVRLTPSASGAAVQAGEVIVIKLSDEELKQQKERDDWQQRGVGGLVKSVDPATGNILLKSGSGTSAKAITVHTTSATVLKRYAPASVSYASAQVQPISAIHPGDQLRARGTKNADGTEIAAEEVISGSFRNISGTVVSLDAANSALVVKDLTTKKEVTVHIGAGAQMRRLPDRMAQMLAARLQAGDANQGAQGTPGSSMMGGDPQQVLFRAPTVQVADLIVGEPVMLVSTPGTSDVTAITLIAGVEPLLAATEEATQNLLSNWSMDTSAGADTSGR